MSHDNPQLLTIDEAADLLRAPVATLRWWRHNGTGPHSFKLGRHVMYRQGDIDEWLERQVAGSQADSA
jgi:excisionase family DNA binding protein